MTEPALRLVSPPVRPACPFEAEDGYHFEPVEEGDDWRLAEPNERLRCRFGASPSSRACGKPAELALLRGHVHPSWWGYCGEHAYRRWVEDGKVLFWRAVRDAP